MVLYNPHSYRSWDYLTSLPELGASLPRLLGQGQDVELFWRPGQVATLDFPKRLYYRTPADFLKLFGQQKPAWWEDRVKRRQD